MVKLGPHRPARQQCPFLRSEEHTSELRHQIISYAVFCLKKKKKKQNEMVKGALEYNNIGRQHICGAILTRAMYAKARAPVIVVHRINTNGATRTAPATNVH